MDMTRFTQTPRDFTSGKMSALIMFVVLLSIGLLISFTGIIDIPEAGYSALMAILGFLSAKMLYKYFKDWLSVLIIFSGFVVGIYVLTPLDPFVGLFFYALGFGIGASDVEFQ